MVICDHVPYHGACVLLLCWAVLAEDMTLPAAVCVFWLGFLLARSRGVLEMMPPQAACRIAKMSQWQGRNRVIFVRGGRGASYGVAVARRMLAAASSVGAHDDNGREGHVDGTGIM